VVEKTKQWRLELRGKMFHWSYRENIGVAGRIIMTQLWWKKPRRSENEAEKKSEYDSGDIIEQRGGPAMGICLQDGGF